MNTAGQTADFNSSAGAEIKVVTKRGTNAYHGTGYEYYKDNNWSGNSWQNNYYGVPHFPASITAALAARLAGHSSRNDILDTKTFFFFNYEGFRLPQLRDHQSERPLAGPGSGEHNGPRDWHGLQPEDPRPGGLGTQSSRFADMEHLGTSSRIATWPAPARVAEPLRRLLTF